MQSDTDIEGKRRVHYSLIILLCAFIIGLNYYTFHEHIASNPQKIVDFQAKKDELACFRQVALSGVFYSSEKQQLDKDIKHYLTHSYVSANSSPRLLLVPSPDSPLHTAIQRKAYTTLEKYNSVIKNVILLEPSLRKNFSGLAIPTGDYYKTPLGKVRINQKLVNDLASLENIQIAKEPLLKKQALVVKLPLLQHALKKFKIVPIFYGQMAPEKLAQALDSFATRKDTLLIFSADFSKNIDSAMLPKVDSSQPFLSSARTDKLQSEKVYSDIAVQTALLLAKKYSFRPEMIDLLGGGEMLGDANRGEYNVNCDLIPQDINTTNLHLPKLERQLTNLQLFVQTYHSELQQIILQAVEQAKKSKRFTPKHQKFSDDLFNKGASFVSLSQDDKIIEEVGTIIAKKSVAHDIAENIYQLVDEALTSHEQNLPVITPQNIKIFLLTEIEKIPYHNEADLYPKIQPRVDGLILRSGNRQSIFLPSKWKELPDKKEFIKQLKIKAGLNPSYWTNNIKVYRFKTVEITNEN